MLYATILYNGNAELPQNFKKAFELFSKVARKYPTGATASALKNKIEAAKLSDTVRSNANSAASAAGYIATMYLRGEGVAVDNATARQWFEKCAEWECAACYNALGVMNRDGSHGFIKNLLKAREYFVLGAAKSDSNAQANLGEMYYGNHV